MMFEKWMFVCGVFVVNGGPLATVPWWAKNVPTFENIFVDFPKGNGDC